MLWNQVFEFFVKYVFGGSLASGYYEGTIGRLYNPNQGSYTEYFTSNYLVYQYNVPNGGTFYFTLGNYLSLIATIITMVAILLLCVFFIKKIIAIIFRLFNGGNVF